MEFLVRTRLERPAGAGDETLAELMAADKARAAITSLPLFSWMSVEVPALARHPFDPD